MFNDLNQRMQNISIYINLHALGLISYKSELMHKLNTQPTNCYRKPLANNILGKMSVRPPPLYW